MTNRPQPELPDMPPKPQGELFDHDETNETNEKVTCLGMTFENESERRTYFTEILHQKLKDPDFRAIEGFPIGKDEDILALSDPPYYTACPNPWVNDFIEQWEAEKPVKPEGWTYQCEPFAADVNEGKNHPIYNAHSFHTKVPHRAIMRYILHYTEPGDIIFDGFCGTGMTGVAAQMCGNKSEVEALDYRVDKNGTILQKMQNKNGNTEWIPFSNLGTRLCILGDLSPIATFISYSYNSYFDVISFQKELNNILDSVESEYSWLYETKHRDNRVGKINYIVWSDVYICPNCSQEIEYWSCVVDLEKETIQDDFLCPHCKRRLEKKDLDYAWETKYDGLLNQNLRQIKQIPALINYSLGNKRFEKRPEQSDLDLINRIDGEPLTNCFPSKRMMEGRESRRNDSIGLTHVHHYFTKRTRLVIETILYQIFQGQYSPTLEKLLLNLITATMVNLDKRYSFRPNRKGGIIKGTMYVPSFSQENSVFNSINNKLRQYKPALRLRKGFSQSNIPITCSSLTEKQFYEAESIDYIYLDPPFGSNLNYSELSFLWETFIKIWTNNEPEAIENKVQNKGINEYRKLMTTCFVEVFRLLKPGHWMTVEFSNTKASVWNSIQSALSDAGFIVANVSALDKKQGSFKAVTTTTAVKQDLVISAYKPNGGFAERFTKEAETEHGIWDFVRTHLEYLPVVKTSDAVLQHIPERDPRILYDQVVSYYVRNGFMVPLSSHEFQAGLRQRFAERDGMMFLPQEVAEYDKAKLRLGNEIQYALFVSDESSAIDWLRLFLKEKPQTYQEIQPSFMGEAQRSWKKNEKPIELQTLLKQNFLRYDGKGPVPPQIHSYLSSNWKEYRNLEKDDPELKAKAKDRWYVPDPNKAGDIEKQCERALLREFETYKEGNKKLKLYRLLALQAGFKQAYIENDYQTIIDIAERLPHGDLEEDPKLLMWYDLGKTRMEG